MIKSFFRHTCHINDFVTARLLAMPNVATRRTKIFATTALPDHINIKGRIPFNNRLKINCTNVRLARRSLEDSELPEYTGIIFVRRQTYLWNFCVSACSGVSNDGDVQEVHLVILVDPVQVEPVGVHPQCHRSTHAWILDKNSFRYFWSQATPMIKYNKTFMGYLLT